MPIMNMQVKKPGIQPSGTLSITTNGTQDVTTYANVAVQVPKPGPDMYMSYELNSSGTLVKGPSVVAFEPITDVANSCLKDAFVGNITFTGKLDLSSLTTVTGSYGFNNTFNSCTGITSVDMSHLGSITGSYACQNMFKNCSYITEANLDSLTTINASSGCEEMFRGCSRLQEADLDSLTSINGSRACYYMFGGCTGITNLKLSSLTSISGSNACFGMFSGCTSLVTADLSSLESISGQYAIRNIFENCTNLRSVNLSGLKNLGTSSDPMGHIVQGCSNIESVDLSGLEEATATGALAGLFEPNPSLKYVNLSKLRVARGSYTLYVTFSGCDLREFPLRRLEVLEDSMGLTQGFYNNKNLPEASFDCLSVLKYSALNNTFQNCTSLQKLSFYALTPNSFGTTVSGSLFSTTLSGVTGCVVRFPMAIQSTIGSLSGIVNGMGGTNTTILFDIVTKLTGADTNEYTRWQIESTDTATAWKYNDTLYYTAGTTEPEVGDTIYSDSACTIAVTTISSIA